MASRLARPFVAASVAVTALGLFAAPSRGDWPRTPYVPVQVAPTGLAQAAPVIVSDGAGGAIVGWSDQRSGNYDVYAQHLDADGNVVAGWPALGKLLCNAVGDQLELVGAPDGQGGAFFAWRDLRSGVLADIYVIRITSTGVLFHTTPTNGRLLTHLQQVVKDEREPRIIADGSGGAVIAWTLVYTPGSDEDIYGAHVNAIGAIDWSTELYAPSGVQNEPALALTAPGVFVMAFNEGVVGSVDIRVEGRGTSGAFQWARF